MISPNPSFVISDHIQFTAWLITFAVVAFGFRFAKEITVFVLDKMYQFFIQNNLFNS